MVKVKHSDVKLLIKTGRGRSIDVAIMQASSDLVQCNADCQGRQLSYYQDQLTDKGKDLLNLINKTFSYFNHDRSDSMVDYFDVGFYDHVELGKYDNPFKVVS